MKKFEEAKLDIMTFENNVITTSGCECDFFTPCACDENEAKECPDVA